jgi:hypothetical protein
MRVDHGGSDVGMAQQFLNGADVAAALEQVRGEAMPQGVGRCRLGDAGLHQSSLERPLEGLVKQVVAPNHPAARIRGQVILREHPEPRP